ncbi:MAG: hypothetical protein NVS2B8_10540 [Vulcanimicrobiaceae bacterium]
MSQNVARDVKHDDAARVLPTNGALPLPPGPGLRGGAAFVRAAAAGTVLDFLSDLGARYGALASFPLGLQRIVVASDPALVEEILVTRQHAFVRDTGAVLLRELVGEGLLTTDDPAHLERRRLMQPAFHRARVAHYGDLVVAETERLAATWRAGSPIDVGAAMAELTLAALGAALFGRALGAEAAEIADVLARVTRRGGVLAALLAVAGPLVRPVRHAPVGRACSFRANAPDSRPSSRRSSAANAPRARATISWGCCSRRATVTARGSTTPPYATRCACSFSRATRRPQTR